MFRTRHDKDRLNCRTLFETRDGVVFCVLDTETTGLDPDRDHIVQFSAIKYMIRDRKAHPIKELDLYIRPPFPMPPKAEAVHHITDEFLEDKPDEQEAILEIMEFLGPRPIIVGFNVDFDIQMIKSMFRRCNQPFNPYFCLDVLEMMRDVSPDSDTFKLEALTKEYGLDEDLSFHSAIDDVKATGMLLQLAYNYYVENPLPADRERPYINNFWFWKGFNKNQSGVWVSTNLGKMYFGTYRKAWFSSQVDLSEVYVDDMEKYILEYLHINYKQFGQLTERKYEIIMNARRLGIIAS